MLGPEHRSPEIKRILVKDHLRPLSPREDLRARRAHPIATATVVNQPRTKAALVAVLFALLLATPVRAQNLDHLVPRNVSLDRMTYQGRAAVRLIAAPDAANGSSYAIVKDASFQDGTIEVDLAGKRSAGAGPEARGFIGIAFRLQDEKYEYIYLRPTNGRADDQVRRNHSMQYSSHPEFDYARLRKESPEKYESYVDLQPGVWTKYRIEIDGRKARLYVHDAERPNLIVDDLKMEPRAGGSPCGLAPARKATLKPEDHPKVLGRSLFVGCGRSKQDLLRPRSWRGSLAASDDGCRYARRLSA